MTFLTPLPDDVSEDSDWVSALISALIVSALDISGSLDSYGVCHQHRRDHFPLRRMTSRILEGI